MSRKASSSRNIANVFPGGGDNNNFKICQGDVMLGFRDQPTNQNNVKIGKSGISAFPTLNGLSYGQYRNAGEIARVVYFADLAKADLNPTDHPFQ